jgi:hypothetical protein
MEIRSEIEKKKKAECFFRIYYYNGQCQILGKLIVCVGYNHGTA